MNKPIYLGLEILSLSKILMYDYCYNEMKPKYKDRIRDYVIWIRVVS